MYTNTMPTDITRLRLIIAAIFVALILAIIVIGSYERTKNSPSTTPTPSQVASTSVTPSPTATSTETPTPTTLASATPTATATSSPSTDLSQTYTNTTHGFSFHYPTGYRTVQSVYSSDNQTQEYVLLTTDPTVNFIQPNARCNGTYLLSVVDTTTSLADLAKASSWPFVDKVQVTQMTVGGHVAYRITGTYNSQAVAATVGAPARITLIANTDKPIQFSTCVATPAELNTTEYDAIVGSFSFTN